jgi:tRNA(fMet)-specific endonuclease VapC
MTYLLDTDTCISILRQQSGIIQRLTQLAPTECAGSMITIYELFCGVAKAQNPAQERNKVERFASSIIELPLDRAAAEVAANIRAALEKKGPLIGPYDPLIAGQVLTSGLVLVTGNRQEFQRVNGLKLETWA